MSITRIDPQARWSEAVIHNHTVYYTAVPDNLQEDAYQQTLNTLAQIDALLASLNSDKTHILDATLFLPDAADFTAMNRAWDEWVVAGKAPVRCTVSAGLMNPGYKVEIKIIAALP